MENGAGSVVSGRVKWYDVIKGYGFVVPEGGNFWEAFETKLAEFRDVTKGYDEKKLLSLIEDPTASVAAH